jgi:hypothetical protein
MQMDRTHLVHLHLPKAGRPLRVTPPSQDATHTNAARQRPSGILNEDRRGYNPYFAEQPYLVEKEKLPRLLAWSGDEELRSVIRRIIDELQQRDRSPDRFGDRYFPLQDDSPQGIRNLL